MKFGSIITNGPNDVCAQNNILNHNVHSWGKDAFILHTSRLFWLTLHNIQSHCLCSLGFTNKCTTFLNQAESGCMSLSLENESFWIAWLQLIGISLLTNF